MEKKQIFNLKFFISAIRLRSVKTWFGFATELQTSVK